MKEDRKIHYNKKIKVLETASKNNFFNSRKLEYYKEFVPESTKINAKY
jgi:hypothetical protein